MEIARAVPADEPAAPNTRLEEEPPAAPKRSAGQEAIAQAAREVFAERGYHGASIRDIAKRAGLSLSALYYWYESKQHLLAALIEDSGRDYLTRCAKALDAVGDDPVSRLHALVRATIQYRVERQIDSNILTREYRNLEPDNVTRLVGNARAATKVWADVIDAGVSRGIFRCPYPDDARRTIIAACNAIAQWYRPDGELTPTDLVRRYSEIAFRVVDVSAAAALRD